MSAIEEERTRAKPVVHVWLEPEMLERLRRFAESRRWTNVSAAQYCIEQWLGIEERETGEVTA